jgi:glycosyltransferase involved in cell wall biosynthesis
MDVSLIIATRDRCGQLQRCLDAVACLRFERPWELIVVDNGSTDGTAGVIQQFGQRTQFPVRYVFEAKPGLGNAHNAGIAVAQGEIVAFTDDDCYPEPDFLTYVWHAFEDPSLGYIAGRITLHDPADDPMTTIESTCRYAFPPKSFIRVGSVGGANMAFRRKVLSEIGGFDPFFGPGALFNTEDVDAAARASAAGWKGEYRPEVVVRHHHGRKAADIPPVTKSYGIGAGAYHMKLLLEERKFLSFVRSISQVRRRLRASVRSVLWEPVGAAMYAYIYVRQCVHRRDDKIREAGLQSSND